MKKISFLGTLFLLAIMVLSASYVDAQPGGPGGPPPGGGFPGGRPPSGKRPPMGDWNRMGDDQKAQQVKQKKKVKEGDTFKVVGSLRDSVSGEHGEKTAFSVLKSRSKRDPKNDGDCQQAYPDVGRLFFVRQK